MNWNWKGVLQAANQYGMDRYKPGTPQAPQSYVPYEATLNQRGLSNNMQPDNSVIPGTTYQPDNFGNRQPQVITQMEAEQQAEQQAQQQEAAKQQRIKEIEAEIAVIEQRIANRKRAMNRNEALINSKIAALEARKINTQDPVSIWRWKQGRELTKEENRLSREATKEQRAQDLARIEAEKQKNKDEQKQFIRNKISATLPTMSIGWGTSPEQIQQYKNTLAGLKTEAMNNNLFDQYNNILEAEAQLNGQLPQQRAQMAMDAMANATNLFNVTEKDGGFGKDPKKYHDYLLQQYNQIIKEFPEAKYDPAFNKVFNDADKLHRKTVKTNKIKPSGRG